MQKCDVCKKSTDNLIPVNGKKVCKDCISIVQEEEFDTGSLDFGACI